MFLPAIAIVLAAFGLQPLSPSPIAPKAKGAKVVIGYVQDEDEGPLDFIDYAKVTHLNVSFANPTGPEGALSVTPHLDQIVDQAHKQNVKVLISIGGGDASENKASREQYFGLISDANRAGFVAKLVQYLDDHKLDGLDVDLEGDAIGKDYGSFIRDLSRALKQDKKLLSAAVSGGNGGDRISSDSLNSFNFVNVMAYDETGPWEPKKPGQHSSMEFAKQSVAYWLGRGVPKSKLILGVPFYGYGFGDAFTQGGYKFSEIVAQFPGSELQDQVGKTIWYNGIPTIQAKAKFVLDQDLGGIMIWSLNQDAKGKLSLLSAIHDMLAAKSSREFAQQGAYYEEDISSSDHLRAEQAKELDEYIRLLGTSKDRLHALFAPDFSSPRTFVASTQKLRKSFAASVGYPPPGPVSTDEPTFEPLGEDGIGTYYRVQIPVVAGVHAEGIYIVPKGVKGKVPLVISMHGGGGSPEIALFHGGSNYHDMVRGAVKRGYAVFAPQHLFSAPGYPGDIRNRIDERLRLVGTTLTAIEIAKITRSLDILLHRPEIDPKRVAMVGLSYGGYYSLVVPALEPRIKAVVSSCYFGVQEFRYEKDDLSIPSDFRTMDRFSLFRDSEIGALICPRPLLIQAGKNDDPDHRDMGIRLAPEVAAYYDKLGLNANFQFLVFDGGHEFNDASAWEFLRRFL